MHASNHLVRYSWVLVVPVVSASVLLLGGCMQSESVATTQKVADGVNCQAIAGGATEAAFTPATGCQDCSVSEPQKAVDDDPDSAAVVTMPVSVGTDSGGSLRATAQPGIVYATRSAPGVVFSVRRQNSADLGETQAVVRTYLGGTLQEQGEPIALSSSAATLTMVGDTGRMFLGLDSTSKPFDAVEMSITGNFKDITANVFQYCSN